MTCQHGRGRATGQRKPPLGHQGSAGRQPNRQAQPLSSQRCRHRSHTGRASSALLGSSPRRQGNWPGGPTRGGNPRLQPVCRCSGLQACMIQPFLQRYSSCEPALSTPCPHCSKQSEQQPQYQFLWLLWQGLTWHETQPVVCLIDMCMHGCTIPCWERQDTLDVHHAEDQEWQHPQEAVHLPFDPKV